LKKSPKLLLENEKKNISKGKALLNIVATIGACKFSTIEHGEKFLSVFGAHLVSIICLLERGRIFCILFGNEKSLVENNRIFLCKFFFKRIFCHKFHFWEKK
jgi:hypothetical protein